MLGNSRLPKLRVAQLGLDTQVGIFLVRALSLYTSHKLKVAHWHKVPIAKPRLVRLQKLLEHIRGDASALLRGFCQEHNLAISLKRCPEEPPNNMLMLSDVRQEMKRLGQRAPQVTLENNSYDAVSQVGCDRHFARTVAHPSKASLLDLAYEIW